MTPPEFSPAHLTVELLSETTFSAASGAGDVDIDVVHDQYGLPYVPGTTVKRLLASSWREMAAHFVELAQAGREVFGVEQEAGLVVTGILDVGDGTIEEAARQWIRWRQQGSDAEADERLTPAETLELFTIERHQTAVDTVTGAPVRGSLRQRRAVRRQVEFFAPIMWRTQPTPSHHRVLAMAALATRHGGQSRNRGAGHLRITVDGDIGKTLAAAGAPA